MNGAEAIVRTLAAGGVEVCFANPGTTETHLMAAFAQQERMRCVLGLFEGVVTGAADGYARMAGKPAATVLHLGPGLGNGFANLHNARRAFSPVINIVGDHATYHIENDAPLTCDIAGLAAALCGWTGTVADAASAARIAAEALVAARTAPGQVATLIVPADTAWGDAGDATPSAVEPPGPTPVSADVVAAARDALRRDEPTVMILGGRALHEDTLALAGRIAAVTGCDLISQMQNARVERGAGRVPVERVPYPVDIAVAKLARYRRAILVGAREPVAFFAYQEKPTRLLPADCEVMALARPHEDIPGALAWLAEELGATRAAAATQGCAPAPAAPPPGPLTKESIAQALAHCIPENAIVADESITTGRAFFPATHGAAPHTWLQITGGAIGIGLPLAAGAALACPDRKVLALQADGSAMYTIQALWTHAREGLDITTVIFANRAYDILKGEMRAIGHATPAPPLADMLELDRPTIDFVDIARGMGVDGERVQDTEALVRAIRRGLDATGPYLIEAVL